MHKKKEARPEFEAVPVTVMACTPGNFDHANGEECSILTVAKPDLSIEPLVFSMDDSRRLVTKLLVTLATYGDTLAQKLLDDHFAGDHDGNFIWPAPPDYFT